MSVRFNSLAPQNTKQCQRGQQEQRREGQQHGEELRAQLPHAAAQLLCGDGRRRQHQQLQQGPATHHADQPLRQQSALPGLPQVSAGFLQHFIASDKDFDQFHWRNGCHKTHVSCDALKLFLRRQ